jgi:hypothetical protein
MRIRTFHIDKIWLKSDLQNICQKAVFGSLSTKWENSLIDHLVGYTISHIVVMLLGNIN